MRPTLSPGARPLLAGLAGLCLVLALGAGPVLEAVEAQDGIAAARARLARAQEAASATPMPRPLVGADAETLAAAFRGRLEGLAADRAALVADVEVRPDPARPDLPRLHATLRGSAEGLHGLLHALESEAPLVVVEEAGLGVELPADPEIGRGTVLRLILTARGVMLPAHAATGSRTP